MSGYVEFKFADSGKPQETASVKFPFADLAAGTIAAQLVKIAALKTAVEAITLGDLYRTEIVAKDVVTAPGQPSSPFAQVESLWFVKYHNALGVKASMQIPTADLAKLDPNGNNRADLEDTDFATWLTRFQAGVQIGAQACTVDDVLFKGRRSARRRQRRV